MRVYGHRVSLLRTRWFVRRLNPYRNRNSAFYARAPAAVLRIERCVARHAANLARLRSILNGELSRVRYLAPKGRDCGTAGCKSCPTSTAALLESTPPKEGS